VREGKRDWASALATYGEDLIAAAGSHSLHMCFVKICTEAAGEAVESSRLHFFGERPGMGIVCREIHS
jgi:hypothetical protein